MDAASCGPSNALSNLSKHSQRDTSLQNEASQRFMQNQSAQGFKSNFNHVDRTLNQDFESFQGNGGFAPEFQGARFQHQQHLQQQQYQHQQNFQQHPQQQHGQQKWVQDFSQLNIGGSAQSHAPQKDWQAQFMQHRQQQQQQQQQPHHSANQFQRFGPMGPQIVPQIGPQVAPFTLSMRTDLSEPLTEHREVHEQEFFDQHFNEVEQELQQEMQQQNIAAQVEVSVHANESEKEEFAKAAQRVRNSMMKVQSEEIAIKFQNSNFLKLMSSIGNRSVELEGDKLVDTKSGWDIREHLADPLREVKEEMREKSRLPDGVNESSLGLPYFPNQFESHLNTQPPQEIQREQTRSHLPDPMEHIKEGGLDGITDPLMAAKIISGGQIKDQHWFEGHNNDDDWLDMTEDAPVRQTFPVRRGKILNDVDQEIFDDYRHDDDYY